MKDWQKYVIALVLIVAIIYGVSFGYQLILGMVWPFISLSPTAFLLVIVSGVIAFMGWVSFRLTTNTTISKFCFNLSPLVLFFGIVGLEIGIFFQYLPKSQIPAALCSSSETNVVNIASCILTGYKVEGYSSWTWASFWIFYIILPFTFVFVFLYGLFYPLKNMFGGGGIGNSVVSVLSFVVAAYATRQIFGAFLLDLFGYGAWGLVGIFIPLALCFGLKSLLEGFLKPMDAAKDTVWSDIYIQATAELGDIQQQIRNLEGALRSGLATTTEALNAMKTQLQQLEQRVIAVEGVIKKLPSKNAKVYEATIKELLNVIKGLSETVKTLEKKKK